MADKEDNLVRKDGGPFSEEDFFKNPGEYTSVFFDKVSQLCVETRIFVQYMYSSMDACVKVALFNCIYDFSQFF